MVSCHVGSCAAGFSSTEPGAELVRLDVFFAVKSETAVVHDARDGSRRVGLRQSRVNRHELQDLIVRHLFNAVVVPAAEDFQ